MSIILWSVLGLITGFLGSRLTNRQGEGIHVDLVVGVAGALSGGIVFNILATTRMTGLSLGSLVVAGVGSVVLLLSYYHVWLPHHA